MRLSKVGLYVKIYNLMITILNNINGLLYLVIINVYLVLIIGFALCFTTMPNKKLYIKAF